MSDPNRRYHELEVAEHTLPDGTSVRYRRRRMLPRGGDLPVLGRVTISEGDRLDLLTARSYGSADALWRICDANDCMNPLELTEEVGVQLTVPIPQ